MHINIINKMPDRIRYILIKKNVYDISDDEFLNIIESLSIRESSKYLDLLVDKYNKKEANDAYIIRLVILCYKNYYYVDAETKSKFDNLKYKIKDKSIVIKTLINYHETEDEDNNKYCFLRYFAGILSSVEIRQVLETFKDNYVKEFIEEESAYLQVEDLNALLKRIKYDVRNIEIFIDNFSDEDFVDFIAFAFDSQTSKYFYNIAKKYILEHITRLKRDNFEKEKGLSLLIKDNINVIKSSDLLHLLSIFNYLDYYGDFYIWSAVFRRVEYLLNNGEDVQGIYDLFFSYFDEKSSIYSNKIYAFVDIVMKRWEHIITLLKNQNNSVKKEFIIYYTNVYIDNSYWEENFKKLAPVFVEFSSEDKKKFYQNNNSQYNNSQSIKFVILYCFGLFNIEDKKSLLDAISNDLLKKYINNFLQYTNPELNKIMYERLKESIIDILLDNKHCINDFYWLLTKEEKKRLVRKIEPEDNAVISNEIILDMVKYNIRYTVFEKMDAERMIKIWPGLLKTLYSDNEMEVTIEDYLLEDYLLPFFKCLPEKEIESFLDNYKTIVSDYIVEQALLCLSPKKKKARFLNYYDKNKIDYLSDVLISLTKEELLELLVNNEIDLSNYIGVVSHLIKIGITLEEFKAIYNKNIKNDEKDDLTIAEVITLTGNKKYYDYSEDYEMKYNDSVIYLLFDLLFYNEDKFEKIDKDLLKYLIKEFGGKAKKRYLVNAIIVLISKDYNYFLEYYKSTGISFDTHDVLQFIIEIFNTQGVEKTISFIKENRSIIDRMDSPDFSIIMDMDEQIKNYFLNNYSNDKLFAKYIGDDDELILDIIKKRLGKDFVESRSKEYARDLIEIYRLKLPRRLHDSNNRLNNSILFNREFIENLYYVTGLDFVEFSQYMYNNSDLILVVNVITKHSDLFVLIYNLLYSYTPKNETLKMDYIRKVATFVDFNEKLCRDISNTYMTKDRVQKLANLFNYSFKIGLEKVEELDYLDEIIDLKIKRIVNNPRVTALELKDLFLKYLFNLSLVSYRDIIDNYINLETIEDMEKKDLSQDQRELLSQIKYILTLVENTIRSSNDIDFLKKLVLRFIATSEQRNQFKKLFNLGTDIRELIRRVFENDMNASLTRIDELPDELYDETMECYDLSESEYGLLIHVTSLDALPGLVTPRLTGMKIMCFNAISDRMVKPFYGYDYHSNNVQLVYDFVPEGKFVGSSFVNLGSNGDIKKNDYDVSGVTYHQLEFKKNTCTGTRNSEFNLFRDGLRIKGIRINGDTPDATEREAKRILEELLKTKVPFIKTQKVNEVIVNPKKILGHTKKNENIKEEKGLEKTVMDMISELGYIPKEEITNFRNVGLESGATHPLFKAFDKNGELVLIKPGMDKRMNRIQQHRVLAVQLGYNIQKIINPRGAVPVDVKEIEVGKNNEKVLCSIVKFIPNTHDFSFLDGNFDDIEYEVLSKNQMETAFADTIVDYLIMNYDAKGANYLTDGNYVYGIDKEQALKNADIKDTFSIIDFKNRSNSRSLFIKTIINAIEEGMQEVPEGLYDYLRNIGHIIDSYDESEYLKLFYPYIDSRLHAEDTSSIISEEEKDVMIENILYKKRNVLIEIEKLINYIEEKKIKSNFSYN